MSLGLGIRLGLRGRGSGSAGAPPPSSIILPAPIIDAVGTVTNPDIEATAGIAMPAPTIDAIGIVTNPNVTGTGDIILPAPTIDAAATVSSLVPTAGYRAWYRAKAGVTGNPNVTAWADQSGNGRNLVGVNNPQYSAGPPPKITFNGTTNNRNFTQASALSNFVSASAWTCFVVFQASSVATNSATGYDNDRLFGDTGQYWGMSLRSNGNLVVHQYDGGDKKALAPYTIGTKAVAVGKFESGNLYARINNGTPVTAAAGNILSLLGTMYVGRENLRYYSGDLFEILVYNTALTAQNITDTLAYLYAEHSITP